jgi:DNA-binding NarL/FixJ family response regulator
LPTAEAVGERATALVLHASGDQATAREHAVAALARYEKVGAVLEAERTRLLLGRILAASGHCAEAVAELSTAAARFDELAAHGHRNAAERELRKLGSRRHRRSSPARHDGSALATLTGREREVAELVAEGRTNPQIATALFLSSKTVETHVRNAFHKLHVSSRLELARLVDQEPTATSGG